MKHLPFHVVRSEALKIPLCCTVFIWIWICYKGRGVIDVACEGLDFLTKELLERVSQAAKILSPYPYTRSTR